MDDLQCGIAGKYTSSVQMPPSDDESLTDPMLDGGDDVSFHGDDEEYVISSSDAESVGSLEAPILRNENDDTRSYDHDERLNELTSKSRPCRRIRKVPASHKSSSQEFICSTPSSRSLTEDGSNSTEPISAGSSDLTLEKYDDILIRSSSHMPASSKPVPRKKIGIGKKGKLNNKKRTFDSYRKKRSSPKNKFKGYAPTTQFTTGVTTATLMFQETTKDMDTKSNDEGNENKLILCSNKDHFVLTQDCCVMCGSFGKDEEGRLLSCSQCGQCYHPFCANVTKISKTMLRKGWRCFECTVCEGCGKPTDESRLLLCDECDVSFHTYCLDPPLENVPQGTWKCKWCVVCVKCGNTTPGHGSLWESNYTLCGPCASQDSCSFCRDGYKEDDLIVQCQQCSRWLHGKCDSMEDEDDCEIASCLDYVCANCRPIGESPCHITARKNKALKTLLLKRAEQRAESVASMNTDKNVSSEIKKELSETVAASTGTPANSLDSKSKYHFVDGVYLTDTGNFAIKSLAIEQPKKSRNKRKNLQGKEEEEKEDKDETSVELSLEEKKLKQKQQRLEKLGIGGFFVKQRGRLTSNKDEEEVDPERSSTPEADKPKRKRRNNKKKSQLADVFPVYLQEAFFGKSILANATSEYTISDNEDDENDLKSEKNTVNLGSLDMPLTDSLDTADDVDEDMNFLDENLKLHNDELGPGENFDFDFDMLMNDERNDGLLSELTNNEKDDVDDKADLDLELDPNLNFSDIIGDSFLDSIGGKEVDDLFNESFNDELETQKIQQQQQPIQPSQMVLQQPVQQLQQQQQQSKVELPPMASHSLQQQQQSQQSPHPTPQVPHQTIQMQQPQQQPLPQPHMQTQPPQVFQQIQSNSIHYEQMGGQVAQTQILPQQQQQQHAAMPHSQQQQPQIHPQQQLNQQIYGMPSQPQPQPAVQQVPTQTPMQDMQSQWQNNGSQDEPAESSQNQKNTAKWEAEEAFGEMATISPVLYANKNFPKLKIDYPVWGERYKQITKLWRQLTSDQRQPYLQMARDNRAANRVQKSQNEVVKKEPTKTEQPPPATPTPQLPQAQPQPPPPQAFNDPYSRPPQTPSMYSPAPQVQQPPRPPMQPMVQPRPPAPIQSPISPMMHSPRMHPRPPHFPPQAQDFRPGPQQPGSFSPASVPLPEQNYHSNPGTPQSAPDINYKVASPYPNPRTPGVPFSPMVHSQQQDMAFTGPQDIHQNPQSQQDLYKMHANINSKPHTPDSFHQSMPSTPQPNSPALISAQSPVDVYARSPATPAGGKVPQDFPQQQPWNQGQTFSPSYNPDAFVNSPGSRPPGLQRPPGLTPRMPAPPPIRRSISVDPYSRQPMTPMPGTPEDVQDPSKQQHLRNLLQVSQVRRQDSLPATPSPRSNWSDSGFRQPMSPAMQRPRGQFPMDPQISQPQRMPINRGVVEARFRQMNPQQAGSQLPQRFPPQQNLSPAQQQQQQVPPNMIAQQQQQQPQPQQVSPQQVQVQQWQKPMVQQNIPQQSPSMQDTLMTIEQMSNPLDGLDSLELADDDLLGIENIENLDMLIGMANNAEDGKLQKHDSIDSSHSESLSLTDNDFERLLNEDLPSTSQHPQMHQQQQQQMPQRPQQHQQMQQQQFQQPQMFQGQMQQQAPNQMFVQQQQQPQTGAPQQMYQQQQPQQQQWQDPNVMQQTQVQQQFQQQQQFVGQPRMRMPMGPGQPPMQRHPMMGQPGFPPQQQQQRMPIPPQQHVVQAPQHAMMRPPLQKPSIPTPEMVNDQNRPQLHNYEQWLINQNNHLTQAQKYQENEVGRLRKIKKSLNAKQRQLRKNQGELTEPDMTELNRVTSELGTLQKQLDQARKQLRQHTGDIQDYRSKYSTNLVIPGEASVPPTPVAMQASPRAVNSPMTALNISGPNTPHGMSSTPQSPAIAVQSPGQLMQSSPMTPMLPQSPMNHGPQIVQDDNNPFSDGFMQKEKKQPVVIKQPQQWMGPGSQGQPPPQPQHFSPNSGYATEQNPQGYYQQQPQQFQQPQQQMQRPPMPVQQHYVQPGQQQQQAQFQQFPQQPQQQQGYVQNPNQVGGIHYQQQIRRPPPPPYPGNPQHQGSMPPVQQQQQQFVQRTPGQYQTMRMVMQPQQQSPMMSPQPQMAMHSPQQQMHSVQEMSLAQDSFSLGFVEEAIGEGNGSDPVSFQQEMRQLEVMNGPQFPQSVQPLQQQPLQHVETVVPSSTNAEVVIEANGHMEIATPSDKSNVVVAQQEEPKQEKTNALLKQLLQNCPAADVQETPIPLEPRTVTPTLPISLPQPLVSSQSVSTLQSVAGALPQPVVTPQPVATPQPAVSLQQQPQQQQQQQTVEEPPKPSTSVKNTPEMYQMAQSIKAREVSNGDISNISIESVGGDSCDSNQVPSEKKMSYLDIRREQLLKEPTPPAGEPKPKRKRASKRKEKSVDDISENSNSSCPPTTATPKVKAKRQRKGSQNARTEENGVVNDTNEQLMQQIMKSLREFPPLAIIQPKISHNYNFCLPPDAPDLNSKVPKLKGCFGDAQPINGFDYYSTFPFGPNKASPTVPTYPSVANSLFGKVDGSGMYFEEFTSKIPNLDDHLKERGNIFKNYSLFSRDLDSPDTVISASSPESVYYDEPEHEYNCMKYINEFCEDELKKENRCTSPMLYMPIAIRPKMKKEVDDDNKENIVQDMKDQALKDFSNVTLRLRVDHSKSVIDSLAKILGIDETLIMFEYAKEEDFDDDKNEDEELSKEMSSAVSLDDVLPMELEDTEMVEKEITDIFKNSEEIEQLPELKEESIASEEDDEFVSEVVENICLDEKKWKNSKYFYWKPQIFKKDDQSEVIEPKPQEEDVGDELDRLEICVRPRNTTAEKRCCLFCKGIGDGVIDGPSRLLNMDVDKWVHLNCALWSAEVVELLNGSLMNVQKEFARACFEKCVCCNQTGASLKCFRLKCTNQYHFPCALKAKCMFFKDKSLFCPLHAPKSILPNPEEMTSFVVWRKVFVNRDESSQIGAMIRQGDADHIMRIGSLTFLNIGQLLPHQIDSFHSHSCIFPIGYKISRFYWSPRRLGRRCQYICTINDVDNSPEFQIEIHEEGLENLIYKDKTAKAVWENVLSPIRKMREEADTIKVFTEELSGEDLFGLSEPTIVRILESLPGIDLAKDYTPKFGRNPCYELPLAINPTGSARTEPFMRNHFKRHQTLKAPPSSSKNFQTALVTTVESTSPYVKQFVHSKVSQYRKMKLEWRSNVYLARSRIAGLGLYAKKEIEKHTMIIEYIGLVIRNEISERRERVHEEHKRGIYMFRLDENRVIDATLEGGLARYINHSCDPNCVTELVQIERENKILIIANRKIMEGEELSYDYKFEFEDDQSKIPCMCGAANCRKWMN